VGDTNYVNNLADWELLPAGAYRHDMNFTIPGCAAALQFRATVPSGPFDRRHKLQLRSSNAATKLLQRQASPSRRTVNDLTNNSHCISPGTYTISGSGFIYIAPARTSPSCGDNQAPGNNKITISAVANGTGNAANLSIKWAAFGLKPSLYPAAPLSSGTIYAPESAMTPSRQHLRGRGRGRQ